MLRSMAAANAEIAAAAKRVQVAQAQVQDAIQGRTKAEQVSSVRAGRGDYWGHEYLAKVTAERSWTCHPGRLSRL